MEPKVNEIINESDRRYGELHKVFNPITGEGSILERKKITISDFPIETQYVPVAMLDVPLVKQVVKAGSISAYITDVLVVKDDDGNDTKIEDNEENRHEVIKQLVRLRCYYDFCFWAALLVWIHPKGGGDDVHFILNYPQRILISMYETMRLDGVPIRVILLKARQWGGSTATQMYFAWLQLVVRTGLNSLIISHVLSSSYTILDMFNNMLDKYPVEMLYEAGATFSENEKKWCGVGQSSSIHEIPQRNCKVKVGTAEKPDNDRSGDYNLVHLSEVGLWKKTEGKSPEDIVQGATSGIPLLPYTMIVIESTAKGTGNFFHREYIDAKQGLSQFKALFIAWYMIEMYELPFKSEDEKKDFAAWLYKNRENRNANSNREEPGIYLWWLWQKGAFLEQIHWYIEERKKYNDHGQMASEYPSDDIEAFVHSGERVFDRYQVEKFRDACRSPKFIGDVYADGDEGEEALQNIRFKEDHQGLLWIWEKPDIDPEEIITDRYLVVVDIGGRSAKADWSVICVFDRLYVEDDKAIVVAQWYGHIDMDLLSWKAAQIAAYYDNALLVIESNTLETHEKERYVDGDQSQYILNQIKDVYDNLYERKQSDDEIQEGAPKKYGFHTNTSTKPKIISNLIKFIREQNYVERDQRCLDEYITYERKQNGAFGAIDGKHDDLLMTRAIGLWISSKEMDYPQFINRDQMHLPKKRAVSAASF